MIGIFQFGWSLLSLGAIQAPQLRPEAASSIAEGVDHLYFVLTFITLFFTVAIFSAIFFFMVKYRRRAENEIPLDTGEHLGARAYLDDHSNADLCRTLPLGFQLVF